MTVYERTVSRLRNAGLRLDVCHLPTRYQVYRDRPICTFKPVATFTSLLELWGWLNRQ